MILYDRCIFARCTCNPVQTFQNLLCSSAHLGLWIGTSVVPGGKNCAAALTVATTRHKVMAAAMAAKAAAQGRRFEAQKLHPHDGIDKLIEETTTFMYLIVLKACTSNLTSNLCGAILVSVETCVLLCLLDSFLSRSTDRNMTLWETDSTSTLPGEVAKGIVRRVENHMILSMTSVSMCAKVSVRLSMELMQTWCMLCQREVDSFRIWCLTYTMPCYLQAQPFLRFSNVRWFEHCYLEWTFISGRQSLPTPSQCLPRQGQSTHSPRDSDRHLCSTKSSSP